MVLVGGRRKKTTFQEWRIWPFLTACTGTQLAYAILHMVVKDSFACVLTVFSFIGSLCCIISRRSEVVLANLLLQVVAFLTLFICCCLGTSSMHLWHNAKRLVPLIVSHILFFAALLILNALLLALKKRQQRNDAAKAASVFGNWKKASDGRTQGSVPAYTRSYTSHTSIRLQQQREEQPQSEGVQNQQVHSCHTHVSTGMEQPCRARVSLLHVNRSHGIAWRDPSLGYTKEFLDSSKESGNPPDEEDTDNDEAAQAATMCRASRPHMCERFAGSTNLVIRSQQIDYGAQERIATSVPRGTSQGSVARLGRSSCSSATPVMLQQGCTLHGRVPHLLSRADVRGSDSGTRAGQGSEAPAAPWSPAAGGTGGMGVFVINYEREQKGKNMPFPLCPSTPRRCRTGHFLDRSASCSCPQRTPRACPSSSALSQHSCVSLHDGATGCGGASVEPTGLSFRPLSTRAQKYFAAGTIVKTVRRWWETALNYLSQAVDCDRVMEATNENTQQLHRSASTTDVTPSRTTAGDTGAKAEGFVQERRPRETLSISRNPFSGGESSGDDTQASERAVGGERSTCTELKDKTKDAVLEDQCERVRQQRFSGVSPNQELATAQHSTGGKTQTHTGESQSPAVPPPNTLRPFKSLQGNKGGNSLVDHTSATQTWTSAADERPDQRAQDEEIEGRLLVGEAYTEPEQQILAKGGGRGHDESQYYNGGATPTKPPTAAKFNTEPLDSSGDVGSELSCPAVEMMPRTPKGKHQAQLTEEMQLDCGKTCEGVDGTAGDQSKSQVPESGKGGQILGYSVQLVSDDCSALSDDELTLRSRSVDVLVNPLERGVIKGDNPYTKPQLEHTGNPPAKCEAVNDHGMISISFTKDITGGLQGTTTPSKTRDASRDSFNRLPASTVTVDEDGPSFLVPTEQARGGDSQLANSTTPVTDSRELPFLNCSSEAVGRVGGPTSPAGGSAAVTGNGFPVVDWENERESEGPFLSGGRELPSCVSQSAQTANERNTAAQISAAPTAGEMNDESFVCTMESDKSLLEVNATRDVTINRFSSEKSGEAVVGERVEAPCVGTDKQCLNAHADREATGVKAGKLPSPSSCSWDTRADAQCSVDSTALKLGPAGTTNTDKRTASFTTGKAAITEENPPLAGCEVSTEKVVYTDNLAREVASNTASRNEEEDDSWEDESEETDGQIQDDKLAREGNEKTCRSEWELSDLSDAGMLSEKRHQRHGTQKSQKSRVSPPAESSTGSGKNSVLKRNRNYRRCR